MSQVATTGRHGLAIAYALLVTCSTLLPVGTDLWLFVFDTDRLLPPRFVGQVVVLGALAGGLMLAVLAWRRRHLWMSRLSLPLVGYMALCGVGLALLVLVSQPPRYLSRMGMGELRSWAEDLDVRHIISYFGFAVVVAFAWRQVSLLVIGVLLMAFGYCLELAQELVPSRIFRLQDLVSNGLGILLGLCWVYLYDSLVGVRGTGLSRLARFRRRRLLARQSRARAAVQPRRS
jgi:hypothetical protein